MLNPTDMYLTHTASDKPKLVSTQAVSKPLLSVRQPDLDP